MSEDKSNLIPVFVKLETAQPRDTLLIGKADADEVARLRREMRYGASITIHEAQTLIKYNRQSGSLTGLLGGSFSMDGWGVSTGGKHDEPMTLPVAILSTLKDNTYEKLSAQIVS